jgi:NAD+-dependent protein deacetylase sirtuin 5
MKQFCDVVKRAKKVVVLTGAGISAESGVPTFRGAGGLWRTFEATQLATPEAFFADPSLVWEFYHYRRELVSRCKPNAGHAAVASLQRWCADTGKDFTLVTQNVDRLHQAAGSQDVVEMHGSLWLVKPVHEDGKFVEEPGVVWEDRSMPICPALKGKGAPDATSPSAAIPAHDLPCRDGILLRPAVVWFGEHLDERTMSRCTSAISECDVLLVVGTSAVVYPAAGFAPDVAHRGGTVAEFNLDETPTTDICKFKFHGPASKLLPEFVAGL